MFRKLSIATLMFVGALAMAPNANAGTATGTVTFSGTVSNSCSFTNPTPGTLTSNTGTNTLATNNTGGVAGKISITCAGAATLTIGDPVSTGGTGTSTPSKLYAELSTSLNASPLGSPGDLTASNPTSISVPNNGFTDTGDLVNITVQFAAPPAVGTYNYQTTITATY